MGLRPNNEQKGKLHDILNRSKTASPLKMMAELGDDLRIGKIEVVDPENIESIKIASWMGKNGRPFTWSGLKQEDDDEVPCLRIDPNAKESGKYSKLTVKWKVKPEGIGKNDIFYRIVVMAGDEEITEPVDQPHSGRSEEKIIFTNDSFTSLDEQVSISSAKVVISVLDKEKVNAESEIFSIVSGETESEEEKESTGKQVRTFSEGAIDLEDRRNIAISARPLDKSKNGKIDPKDFLALTLRENDRNKNYRVFYPPLMQEVEKQWVAGNGALGRWTIKVRESGDWAREKDALEFKPVEGFARIDKSQHERLMAASAKMSRLFGLCGGPGQIYDEKNAEIFDTVSGYLNGWSDVFSKNDDPNLTLCHTVEVQSLSERTIGLIVLPSHPLRVAWHAAYDNLLLHAAFEESKDAFSAKDFFEGVRRTRRGHVPCVPAQSRPQSPPPIPTTAGLSSSPIPWVSMRWGWCPRATKSPRPRSPSSPGPWVAPGPRMRARPPEIEAPGSSAMKFANISNATISAVMISRARSAFMPCAPGRG